MLNDNGLKPCPFCAYEDTEIVTHYPSVRVSVDGNDGDGYQGYCDECETAGPVAATKQGAIILYNNRPAEED